ncbi:MAG: lytic transglycosylase domain-containing protein [Deltaproteobacteria bacterium]|nr:lytic transglycosylase domain-containing protein [Deltaproteobacteria bacterium]
MRDQSIHLCARGAAVALLGATCWLTTACSTLQNLGTPIGHGSHARLAAPGVAASRDRVDQILEDRAPNLEDRDRQGVIDAIFSAQQEHGFEPSLLLALMQVESGFNPSARSSQGALGLMQVQPFSGQLMARELGIEWRGKSTLLDPEQNVRIGVAYLARMHETFRDIELSLAAYNVGPGRLQEILESGKRPTGSYARKVKSSQAELASVSSPARP